jgi:hypothetical protein
MKKFIFNNSGNSVEITIIDTHFVNAILQLKEITPSLDNWKCDNEDGEEYVEEVDE